MKISKGLAGILKVILPLGLGIFLILYIYRGFTPEAREQMKQALLSADYSYVLLSIFLGILSHVSRALRWLLLLRSLGHQPTLLPSFYSVMIGYLANLAFPRLGEVSRCGAMSKATGIPFQQLFGTVIAERVIDLIILISFTLTTFYLESDVIGGFVSTNILTPLNEKVFSGISATGWVLLGVAILATIIVVLKFVLPGLLLRIKNFIRGVAEGFRSVLTVRRPWLFIAHTLFIWLMYYLMYRVCFFSLSAVSDAPEAAVLASFVMGSFGVVATQGGIGAYHGLVAVTLLLYGISFPDGYAFAWIAWSGQTLMILLAGFFSLIALPLVVKRKTADGSANTPETASRP